MPIDNDDLDGAEIVMLVEALDALLPFPEDARDWTRITPEERERWAPYARLRSRLKQKVHMSFYDRADNWLARELRAERFALAENLHSRLMALLREPGASRRTIREGFIKAIQELRETRQSKPRPLS